MTKPAPRKKRPRIGLYLKERDKKVVKTLWDYRIMRESTLHRLCFPTVAARRKVQERLKQLRDAGYLDRRSGGRRFEGQAIPPDPSYWAERSGVEELLTGAELSAEQRERLRVNRNLSRWQPHRLTHLLDLAEVRACLELAVASTPGVLLAQWYDEHDCEGGEPILGSRVQIPYGNAGRQRPFALRPDAAFVLEHEPDGRQEFFFLEIDEGTEAAKKRWREQKVPAYLAHREFEEKFEFAGEDFRVLTVCRSQADQDNARRQRTLLRATFQAGGRGRFWVTTFSALMPDRTATGEHFLASQIWQRARPEEIRNRVSLSLGEHLFADS